MSLTTLYESDLESESVIAPQKPEKRSSVDSTTSTTSTSSWRSSSSSRMKRLSTRFSGLFNGSKHSSMPSMAPPPATIRRSSSTPGLNGRMSGETLKDAPVVTPAYLMDLSNFDYDSFGPTPGKGKWRAQDQWRPEDLQGNYAIM